MAESGTQQFYKHDFYAASYYAIYVALEKWVSTVALRKDMSRIFLASDGYAFRKRHELTDLSQNYEDLSFTTLDLPFANYWPLQEGWQPDTRIAANPASLLYTGISNVNRMLRSMMVTNPIPVTFYFDREDDARLAYDTLLWYSYREHYLYTTVLWENEQIQVPLNIKVQNLSFNPDFTEKDWLETNRILPVRADFEVRSAIFSPVTQPDYTGGDIVLDDNQSFSLTEEVILEFYNDKGLLGSTISIDSLFTEVSGITINEYSVLGSTFDSVRLYWDIVTESPLDLIQIEIVGRPPIILSGDDVLAQMEYVFRDLEEGSSYIANVTFITENENSKTVSIQFNTPLSTESQGDVQASRSTVVGTSW